MTEKGIIFILLPLLLIGCSTLPQRDATLTKPTETWETRQKSLENLTSWKTEGTVSIRNGNHSQSAQFFWQQKKENYTLSLAAPLGSGSAVISGSKKQALLQLSSGETHVAQNSTDLLYQYTSWYFPTEYFAYWIRGLPAANIPERHKLDESNRLHELTQDGWHITYTRYQTIDGIELPQRMTLTYGDLTIRLVIRNWTVWR